MMDTAVHDLNAGFLVVLPLSLLLYILEYSTSIFFVVDDDIHASNDFWQDFSLFFSTAWLNPSLIASIPSSKPSPSAYHYFVVWEWNKLYSLVLNIFHDGHYVFLSSIEWWLFYWSRCIWFVIILVVGRGRTFFGWWNGRFEWRWWWLWFGAKLIQPTNFWHGFTLFVV